jgi:ribonuclease P protein component
LDSRPPKHPLNASSRLKKRREFKRIQRGGKKIWGRRFIYTISQGATQETRIGITVSRKAGNAVKRNRIKRWVREVFRTHPHLFPDIVDVVVIAKRDIEDFSYAAIRDEFVAIFTRFFDKSKRG